MNFLPPFARTLCPVVLLTGVICVAQEAKGPMYVPPLAEGGAPECPVHTGTRTLSSETIQKNGILAVIVGSATRSEKGNCRQKAGLQITGKVRRTIPLTNADKRSFELIDFSRDGRFLLSATSSKITERYQHRDVEISRLEIPSGRLQWINAWDIFHWSACDAMVEPQGFAADGSIILRARPSVVRAADRPPDCVKDEGLYKVEQMNVTARLDNDITVSRFAKLVAEATQACKTDPDIIGPCFTFRGRLSAWNGNPTLRIWRVGTKRILGTRDDPLPANLQKHMSWGVEAWGDFTVCPFTREKPGVMQSVCVESARNVFYKDDKK